MAPMDDVEDAWDDLMEVPGAGRNSAGHLHELHRGHQGPVRAQRRGRLHLIQRRRGPEVGLRAGQAGVISARPAPGTQHGAEDGRAAGRDGGLEPIPQHGRQHAGATAPGEDGAVAGALLGTHTLHCQAGRAGPPALPRRQRAGASRVRDGKRCRPPTWLAPPSSSATR